MTSIEQVDEAEFEALLGDSPLEGGGRPAPIITEGHRLWGEFQAGLCCEYVTYGCPTEGRRCVDHGGCCGWPRAVHWPASEQARIVPGVKLQVNDEPDDFELTVVEIGSNPFDERIFVCREASAPKVRWELSFRPCGAAHYAALRGDGGGSGCLVSLRVVAEQVALL